MCRFISRDREFGIAPNVNAVSLVSALSCLIFPSLGIQGLGPQGRIFELTHSRMWKLAVVAAWLLWVRCQPLMRGVRAVDPLAQKSI